MPYKKKKVNSNSKKSKGIIRSEIRAYVKPHEYGKRSTVDAMKMDADAYHCGDSRSVRHSDYQKGAGLVDGGRFACYWDDQRKMLRKIYGSQVDQWSGHKVHGTYKHLIGREYEAMLREKKQRKQKKKGK